MDEQIYFEDNGGNVVVSNQRFTLYNERLDVTNIDDFDLENRRSLDGLSLSLNDGIKIGTPLVQLVLTSPLGSKPVYLPMDLRNRIDQVQLRGIVLALSRAIGERKLAAPHRVKMDAPQSKPPRALSKPITVEKLPRSLSQIEAKVLNLMQDQDEEYQALNRRFIQAISVLLNGVRINPMNHAVTTKVIYEYQRVHGHRNSFLGIFGNSGVTIGSVFRPLPPAEVPTFEEFCEQLFRHPLPKTTSLSEV